MKYNDICCCEICREPFAYDNTPEKFTKVYCYSCLKKMVKKRKVDPKIFEQSLIEVLNEFNERGTENAKE